MSYRNKTYVAFASEDIASYRLMTAWKANKRIDFNFFDAHDLNIARDSSQTATIKRRLRERLSNAKQVVLLGSAAAKRKGGDGRSFLAYEVETIIALNLPVVIANLDGSKTGVAANQPKPFAAANYYTMSVPFRPAIIKFALDDYVPAFLSPTHPSGDHHYTATTYQRLGI